MAKVTMYRGIDPTDRSDVLVAVSGDVYAVNFYKPSSQWLTPECFGGMAEWASAEIPEFMTSFFTDEGTEVLWEADL